MNKLESAHAAILQQRKQAGEIREYWFEPFKIRMADNTFHEPDFLVQMHDDELVIHEVKGGFFPEHNRLKSKLAAALFPMRYVLCQYKNKKTGWTYTEL